jgi:hypothetical protein
MRRINAPLAIGFAAAVAMLAAASTPATAVDYSSGTTTTKTQKQKKTVKTHKPKMENAGSASSMQKDTTPPPRSISNY